MNRDKRSSLHSKYNPQIEAERYIEKLSLNGDLRYFILIEPGLGYIIAPLKKKIPGAKTIALYVEKPINQLTIESPMKSTPEAPDSQWYPETGISLQDFLEVSIPDDEASKVKILEWRPALAVYGKAYLTLVEQASIFIKRIYSNRRTVMAFGARWFKNFFKNLDFLKNVLFFQNSFPVSLPLLVTGAGPALEESIPLLKTCPRSGFFILASSSSSLALEAEGIFPDMVITSDGSQWAKFHLYDHYRNVKLKIDNNDTNWESFCLAAALTAALPSQCETTPVLAISDGSFWQALILKELAIPFIALPQRGTVTATALDLAFNLTKENIYITGMDLVNRDIRSHSRPYSFDRFIQEKASRHDPQYSQSYKRALSLKTGGSYGVYASWFQKQLSVYPRPIYSLGNNNPLFGVCQAGNFHASNVNGNRDKNTHQFFKTVRVKSINPSQLAFAVLEKALKDPVNKTVQEELISLLLPDQEGQAKGLFEKISSLLGFIHEGNNERR